MLRHPSALSRWIIAIIMLAGLFLAGCESNRQTEAVGTELPDVATPNPTSEPEPTPTQTPVPGKLVLIANSPAGTQWSDVKSKAAELAASSGLTYEERASLQVSEISADWKIVILLAYDPLLSDALTAAPYVQFIVFSEQELGMATHLNVIRVRWEYQAFMAGYLSTIITPDWRMSGLFPPGETGTRLEEAFLNGGHYYCGICNSILSPVKRFPLSGFIAADASTEAWQTAIETLRSNILYSFYVAPESANPEMLVYLAQSGMVLVGGETPPDELRPRWAATVKLDFVGALEQIWAMTLEGEGGNVVDTPVLITDVNEDYFSPGKQRLVEETQQELLEGWIEPLDVDM